MEDQPECGADRLLIDLSRRMVMTQSYIQFALRAIKEDPEHATRTIEEEFAQNLEGAIEDIRKYAQKVEEFEKDVARTATVLRTAGGILGIDIEKLHAGNRLLAWLEEISEPYWEEQQRRKADGLEYAEHFFSSKDEELLARLESGNAADVEYGHAAARRLAYAFGCKKWGRDHREFASEEEEVNALLMLLGRFLRRCLNRLDRSYHRAVVCHCQKPDLVRLALVTVGIDLAAMPRLKEPLEWLDNFFVPFWECEGECEADGLQAVDRYDYSSPCYDSDSSDGG